MTDAVSNGPSGSRAVSWAVPAYAIALFMIPYALSGLASLDQKRIGDNYDILLILACTGLFMNLAMRPGRPWIAASLLIIAMASLINLASALIVVWATEGGDALISYTRAYALPTLLAMVPLWLASALAGGLLGMLVRRIRHRH